MVFGKLLIAKLKEKGIDNAEKVAKDIFVAIKESAAETAVHPEAEKVEMTIALVAAPIIAGLESAVDKAIDFDKDGKVG